MSPMAKGKKARPSAGKKPRTASSRHAPARAAAKARGAQPKAKAKAMFDRVAFTMFAVEDATRARAFYEEVLGFKRGLASPDGVWTEYDLPGGGCLALFKHPVPGAAKPAGGASIAFEVADLDALNEQLK